VTWGSDDWNWWNLHDRHGRPSAPEQFDTLREILANVPGREIKTLAHVGRPDASCMQFLSAHFSGVALIDDAVERVSPFRPASEVLETGTACHQFDVVLAVETLVRPVLEDLDAVLERVRGFIVEGGLLLATFPAAQRESVAREMRLRSDDSHPSSTRFHEIELQYRLRRARFRGVRIRRILDENVSRETRDESLLCMAVRRANN